MQITYYGHNSFLFKSDVRMLTDPFIAFNPKAKQIVMEDIKADYVLITHGHADHLADLNIILSHNDAKIIAMVEVASWLAKQGHSHSHSLNFGGRISSPWEQQLNMCKQYIQVACQTEAMGVIRVLSSLKLEVKLFLLQEIRPCILT